MVIVKIKNKVLYLCQILCLNTFKIYKEKQVNNISSNWTELVEPVYCGSRIIFYFLLLPFILYNDHMVEPLILIICFILYFPTQS